MGFVGDWRRWGWALAFACRENAALCRVGCGASDGLMGAGRDHACGSLEAQPGLRCEQAVLHSSCFGTHSSEVHLSMLLTPSDRGLSLHHQALFLLQCIPPPPPPPHSSCHGLPHPPRSPYGGVPRCQGGPGARLLPAVLGAQPGGGLPACGGCPGGCRAPQLPTPDFAARRCRCSCRCCHHSCALGGPGSGAASWSVHCAEVGPCTRRVAAGRAAP